MSDERDDKLLPSPAERHIARSRIDDRPAGPLTERQLYTQRSVESYLRGAVMPRYMERLRDITRQTERHERELALEHEARRGRAAPGPRGAAGAPRRRPGGVRRRGGGARGELVVRRDQRAHRA